MAERCTIADIARRDGREVELWGWLHNSRPSGKLCFIVVRDGTGFIQGVAVRGQMPDEAFELCKQMNQESSLEVVGVVRAESRAPGGFELDLRDVRVVAASEDGYPITLKEHGVEFLMDRRHLWLRSPRQHALLRVRAEVVAACRDFLDGAGFTLVDAPILTPAACEGTTTLFETQYFDEKAYLSQSGQLYNEAAAAAFGKAYCFGPTFRAEKSKTRRHLIEFWMVEPEMAFCDLDEYMRVAEEMVAYIVRRAVERRRMELSALGRDTGRLLAVKPPFPRIAYDEALDIARGRGEKLEWGEDLGATAEAAVSEAFALPVFVHRYPAACKAFYMEPDPARPEVALCADLLAPEGYGEIVGGGQRIAGRELLERRIHEHKLPVAAYGWYLDLRRWGTTPHSGFGLGIERTVAWIAGIEHIREAIPFPRLLNRIYP